MSKVEGIPTSMNDKLLKNREKEVLAQHEVSIEANEGEDISDVKDNLEVENYLMHGMFEQLESVIDTVMDSAACVRLERRRLLISNWKSSTIMRHIFAIVYQKR